MSSKALPTIAEAVRLTSSKEATPGDLVRQSLAHMKETEPKLNATCTICEEEALRDAARLDALVGSEEARNMPLFGVPLTVKDLFCTKGVRTTAASRMLENFIPPYDAHVVDALKKAGAIVVAKTNTDEFAMGATTESSCFGPSRNPWDTTRTPGGSSGGAASSTAAGQACGALASDSGGSIRLPAGLCGCVGIKPTYGRVSRYGCMAYASSFDQAGVICRTVEDCALMMETIAGYDPKDATCANLPVPAYSRLLARSDLKGITLGLPKELWGEGISPDVLHACKKAVQTAKELGAEIREVSIPHLPYSGAVYSVLATGECSTNLARFDGVRYGLRAGDENGLLAMYESTRTLGFGLEVKRRIMMGTWVLSIKNYERRYIKATKVRRLLLQDYEAALAGCDALLAPTSLEVASVLGAHAKDGPLHAYMADALLSCLNLVGLPGLSLPVGLESTSGLPVGMQIIGKAFDEASIFTISAALEKHLPKLGVPKEFA